MVSSVICSLQYFSGLEEYDKLKYIQHVFQFTIINGVKVVGPWYTALQMKRLMIAMNYFVSVAIS